MKRSPEATGQHYTFTFMFFYSDTEAFYIWPHIRAGNALFIQLIYFFGLCHTQQLKNEANVEVLKTAVL